MFVTNSNQVVTYQNNFSNIVDRSGCAGTKYIAKLTPLADAMVYKTRKR